MEQHTPYLICVTGLKNSGKTTVCTGLIGGLTARGCAVAALKSSHAARLTLDHRGGDSYALAGSGARFVMVQGRGQSLIVERGSRSFTRMLERVPAGMDFIVSEGGEAGRASAVIVCLADPGAWTETLEVRRVAPQRILAVSGSFAARRSDTAAGRRFRDLPLVDPKHPGELEGLIERILADSGRGRAESP